jgi:hypothetical protein
MNVSPTFRERQVGDMAEKVREANELITKALRTMIPDPSAPGRAGRAGTVGRGTACAAQRASERPPGLVQKGDSGRTRWA